MSDAKNPDRGQNPRANESSGSAKKSYIKPAFRHEQVFETMALACGKINNTQQQCRGNRKSS